jgi:hypothetical protein
MSKPLGDAALKKVVNMVFEKSQAYQDLNTKYRDQINSRQHILDLSREALYSANVKRKSSKAKASFDTYYDEFIFTILMSSIPKYSSLEELVKLASIKETILDKTFFVDDISVLVSPSFGASRAAITRISNQIPRNKYFGKSIRARTLGEVTREEGLTLEELTEQGRVFDPKLGTELIKDPKNSKKLVARTRDLSLVDLGHTPGTELGRDSPLSEQLVGAALSDGALKPEDFEPAIDITKLKELEYYDNLKESVIPEANARITNLVTDALGKLSNVQAKCVVTFKNEIPEKLDSIFGGRGGFLTLTLQLFNVNNDISKKESDIRNTLIREIKEEIGKVVKNIPGSDTMEQDIVNALKARLIDGIKGKGSTSKLKKHDLVNSNVVTKPKPVKKPTKISGKIKTVTNTKKIPASRPVQVLAGTSLISLQNLINRQLQDVISANMGDGDSRNVLNYRTGRLASSAKVEYMSESRAGMITAFYSYMKNPYATFSGGGKQSSPRSRDPKLLISKSIREIAAQQVGNRLRAVNI